MAYFLFIDESGQDHHDSPYEVLAGMAIPDRHLWEFIKDVHHVEVCCFGRRYRLDGREIKARKFLNRKTFRLAQQMPPIDPHERTALARQALDHGEHVTKSQLTALAQAKLVYVKRLFQLCKVYSCRIFASIVKDPHNVVSHTDMLRKDYVYLFERFYYYLEHKPGKPRGIIVFDELDKAASHILLTQMDKYFKQTANGRVRSNRIIPEPLFVHSDLTTGVQIVDFIAYLLSWNFRVGGLDKPCREELSPFLRQIKKLRYRTTRRTVEGKEQAVWSISVI